MIGSHTNAVPQQLKHLKRGDFEGSSFVGAHPKSPPRSFLSEDQEEGEEEIDVLVLSDEAEAKEMFEERETKESKCQQLEA